MIVMIDNYDSFTYNLVQYLSEMSCQTVVHRNDAVTVDEVLAMAPDGLILSPGPGRPEDAGIIVPLIRAASGRVPILGVCLGHQAIGAAFGGRVVRAQAVMHGKVSAITHDGNGVFAGIRSPMKATRYHSLAVERASLPACLEITAEAPDGEIMGMRHRAHATEGIQFHPESVLTPAGKRLLANFVALTAQSSNPPGHAPASLTR